MTRDSERITEDRLTARRRHARVFDAVLAATRVPTACG